MLCRNVPVLFYTSTGVDRTFPSTRAGGKMAEFWWQKVPSQMREMLNKSLAYGPFTSLASVAFRRRHFRLNSDKFPGRRQIAIAVTPEFFKPLSGTNEAEKSGEI